MPQLPPPKAYISFEEFKQCIKNLALNKFWNIAIQEDLVRPTFTTYDYVLPTYEIFINNILHFTLPVPSWILPKFHELYLLYHSSISNVTLSKFIERLSSQYMLCKGITLPDTRKEVNFAKMSFLKKLIILNFKTVICSNHCIKMSILDPNVVNCWFSHQKKYVKIVM